jgi:integrase
VSWRRFWGAACCSRSARPYGSLLIAGGIDLVSVKAAMGHSRITTTERYLHARPAGELAGRFTRALGGTVIPAAAAA